ncbi:MAG TPA: protein-disulfide reductase DsbD domain-containing protein, partial [bacterium]|nr:protein-disulfide reductase DsbD domain-containing protein [bacterium]
MTRSRPGFVPALALAGLLIALPAPAAPPDDGGSLLFGGSEHDGTVRARLIAERAAIAPGELFSVGIEISMDPGWHTYWENGGDAGLPTSVTWDLPEGFTAGPIQWPVPHRYEEEGNIVTFGYADRTLLIVELTSPASLEPGSPVEIAGVVDWLQC